MNIYLHISSIIFSLLVFLYYITLMGFFNKNFKFSKGDQFIIGLSFLVCLVPYLNLVVYGLLFILIITLGLVLVYRKYRDFGY